ncbi:hypothetical protein HNO88_004313 [Novosphingobium chloroacetimidivorans]|uniref:Uncharacterized protein n=1 Tax=Novosphingobium chloroacetimidivorans TaxID=1428314 RepID=A0A7W7KDS5_9SPHN|nr:hypothetical protein [Novosphingobium chloroacetimidivorans]MBB4860967.1 hypothetical protein [Novosphingobium chloroacetimidivorans]
MYGVPVAAPAAGRPGGEEWRAQRFRLCLWIVAVLPSTYNAILAALNAQGLRSSRAAAVAVEGGILALCMAACFLTGGRRRDLGPILLFFFAAIQAIVTSLINETIYPDFLRNMAIVAAFTAVGYRASWRDIRAVFRILSIIVLVVLLIELIHLPLYVAMFQPASYLQASRGLEEFSLNDTGLFANAVGFQGRFSFGIFQGPRTSSIFLEQVSLPGFASVLLVFLLGNWQRISKSDKALHVILVVLIVLSNNSRTSSALLVINAAGYYAYPYLSGRLTAAIMPICLLTAFIVVGPTAASLGTDDTIGRLSITVADLMNLSASELIFGSLSKVTHAYDSGYNYLIVSSSIWGLLGFWIYLTFVPASQTPAQRRVHWGLAVYIYLWLMIGGTAVFTMKTAALLWLVVGNMVSGGGNLDKADH